MRKENSIESELEYLKNRSMTIIDFISSKSPDNDMLIEFKQIIKRTFDKKNLRGLSMISRDTTAWAKGMPLAEILELNEILKKKFNENLSGDKITQNSIKEIINRNRITNKEEFMLISEYLNDISEDDEYFDNVEELEMLLKNYLG